MCRKKPMARSGKGNQPYLPILMKAKCVVTAQAISAKIAMVLEGNISQKAMPPVRFRLPRVAASMPQEDNSTVKKEQPNVMVLTW
mmetsp:Transcript_63462/g.112851  ORF Transcript_63462/g.112851 Transcript_63462/m.112851 type:complete len:85 (+) Transcript_63462:558-812(+)